MVALGRGGWDILSSLKCVPCVPPSTALQVISRSKVCCLFLSLSDQVNTLSNWPEKNCAQKMCMFVSVAIPVILMAGGNP